MAELKKHLLSARVRASTLLEVIVAMVIIMIVFVLATGIFTKVTSSSPSVRQQQIRAVTSSVIKESIAKQNWEDESVLVDSLVLQKTVTMYKDYQDVWLIRVVALERGDEIGESKLLIKRKPADGTNGGYKPEVNEP